MAQSLINYEQRERRASSLRDLKLAVMQYKEDGGDVKESIITLTKKVVIILDDTTMMEWRNLE